MTSKFDEIIKNARGEEREVEPEATAASRPKIRKIEREETPATKLRGRPRAKHSDPDFQQITAYIREKTYTDIKIALLQQGSKQDFSELVEELLSNWLRRT